MVSVVDVIVVNYVSSVSYIDFTTGFTDIGLPAKLAS